MTVKGKDLIFISQIQRNGKGVSDVSDKYKKFLQDEEMEIKRLSITHGTWIASCFNSFVVKLKSSTKKRLKLS